jgi:hypothetical protein
VIYHTEAFARHRSLSQAHLNFVVAVSHAMPFLRADLVLSSPTPSCAPDYFQQNSNPKHELASYLTVYQEEMARSALISVFSYFEGYGRGLFHEIVKFHGDRDAIKKLTHDRLAKSMATTNATAISAKHKLQVKRRPNRGLRYRNFGEALDDRGYKFPTDLFAHFGVVRLLEKTVNDRAIRTSELPSLFKKCLLYPMTAAETDLYERVRKIRNDVAHGHAPAVTLQNSLRFASELHTMAAKIDHHAVEHFFIIQVV